jgi:hypothetical protein
MGCPHVADGETDSNMEGSANILIISRGQPQMVGPPAWVLGELLTTPQPEKLPRYITIWCHMIY